MTPDEMDKKIEFILETLAQTSVNIDNLTANTARNGTAIANLTANMGRNEVDIANLRLSVAELGGILRESIKISDDRFTRLDDKLAKLADGQKITDERLNALINVVERHITGPDHVAKP